MPDSTTWVVVGIGIGVGIGLGAALLLRQRRVDVLGDSGGQGLTVHDVIRDDAGRIQTVETFHGGGAGSQGVSGAVHAPERAIEER